MINAREIHAAWKADTAKLAAKFDVVAASWPVPSGADPFEALDVQRANTAVQRGMSPFLAAEVVAARRLARAHGVSVVREALAVPHAGSWSNVVPIRKNVRETYDRRSRMALSHRAGA